MVTNNAWNSQNPAQVALGGTGVASTTAYAVLCGGTTTTNPLQSIASVGTSGQVLTSNGAGALPTFQAGTGGNLVKIQTIDASSSATISFTTGITNTYTNYLIVISNMVPQTTAKTFSMQVSSNGGVSYLNSGYVTRTSVTNTSNVFGSSSSTTTFILSITNDVVASSTQPYCACIYLYDVSDGNVPTISGQGTYQSTAASSVDTCWFYGYGPTSTTVNALQFSMSSGNITTGKFTLYGILQ